MPATLRLMRAKDIIHRGASPRRTPLHGSQAPFRSVYNRRPGIFQFDVVARGPVPAPHRFRERKRHNVNPSIHLNGVTPVL
jgi:hypothetical protein